MGRMKKKGQAGQARNYITRTQAVKKLQISLPDFRKLCIWKGIYPREPRSRKKASKSSTASTTFYYTKDIQYLHHEPLLQKLRGQKVLEKKISRALGRGDVSDAARLERNAARPETTGRPRHTLDHVVRERYPTFADALRDLDDCLSMLFLFAHLPATEAVPARMIARCERLTLEFQHYLIVAGALRRSFLSIKGIYYQADIQGHEVLWLVPYKFNQRVVGDVDFRIMGTFVEFYMTLLGFVNYRLYTSIGLKYPPRFDQSKDDLAAELGAFSLEGVNPVTNDGGEANAITNGHEAAAQGPDPKVQDEVNKLVRQLKETEETGEAGSIEPATDDPPTEAVADEEGNPSGGLDKFEPVAPGGAVIPQPELGSAETGSLFSNFTFYLSRETPRQPLEFLLRAFGCKRVGWDSVLGDGAYTTDESDPSITHQIVDRPVIQATVAAEGDGEDNQTAQKLGPNRRYPGRIYVQPQWVWDSVNDEELKSPDLYAPGAQLPPHLSPFVRHIPGQYNPTLPLDEQEPEAEALEAALEDEGNEVEDDVEDEEAEGTNVVSGEGEAEDDADSFGGFSEPEEVAEEAEEAEETEQGGSEEEEEDGDSEEDEDQESRSRQLELEAEFSGKAIVAANGSKQKKKPATKAPSNGAGRPVGGGGGAKAEARRKELARQARAEAEEVERAKGMLSKKKRKLFEQMQYSNSKKSAEDARLRAKRRKIEKESGQAGARGRGKRAVA